jgi:hypothetical protein
VAIKLYYKMFKDSAFSKRITYNSARGLRAEVPSQTYELQAIARAYLTTVTDERRYFWDAGAKN